jgi:hypothetical protein
LAILFTIGVITTAIMLSGKSGTTKHVDMHSSLEAMLSSEPAANSDALALWNRMHSFNETFCNQYFLKAYKADS